MQKLEQVGPYLLVRPSPQAVWPRRLPEAEWKRADAVYIRESEGGGHWQWRKSIAREYELLFAKIGFSVKLTDFGHLGLFAEQAEQWEWLRQNITKHQQRSNGANLHVLNLFAYTGGSTLACSQAGAHVVHVDAAKGVVDWARKNAELSGLRDKPIRWIVDEASKFVEREVRRGQRYHGIVLDPPSFGRGPKGEVFKIERDLLPLLEQCRQLLANDALFVLYSCHTPGFTPLVLQNQLQIVVAGRKGGIESGEMTLMESDDGQENRRLLPSGAYARWLTG